MAQWPAASVFPEPRSPEAYPLRGFTFRTLSNCFQRETDDPQSLHRQASNVTGAEGVSTNDSGGDHNATSSDDNGDDGNGGDNVVIIMCKAGANVPHSRPIPTAQQIKNRVIIFPPC